MEQKREKTKATRICAVLSVVMLMFIALTQISIAETKSVKIWDSEGDEHRLNKILAIGVSKEATIGYKLEGITEKSHAWKIDNPEICEIEEDEDGNFTITGIAEGLTRLRLEVVGTDKKTYSDYTVVSVYTPVEGANGTTNKSTVATRSAHSGTENKNVRATLPEGTALSVYGKCGDYYRATVDYQFTDGRSTSNAFVLISDINIPVVGLTLDKTSVEIGRTQRARLRATVVPAIATNNTVTWKSSNSDVVSVNDDGILTGISDGNAVIEATADGMTASCNVKVEGEYVHETLVISSSSKVIDIGEITKIEATSGNADTFFSGNNAIVIVNANGTVEGVSPGETEITVMSLYDEKVSCSIAVKYPNAPKVKYKKSKNNKYTLSWNKVSKVTGYQVYKYNSKKGKYKKYKTIKASGKCKYSVKKGKYKVRSYVKNINGKKFYSAFTVAKESKETKAKYKIIYVANGGKGEKYSQTVDFNKKTRIKANKYKRKGYAFVGWATSPNGEVVLKNKSRAQKLTNKKKIKLYAIWRSDNDPNGKVQRQALLLADIEDDPLGDTFARDIDHMKKVYDSANFDGWKIRTEKFPDKTPGQIKNKLKDIGKNTTKNDVTYIHFSCHGSINGGLTVQMGKNIYGDDFREWLDDYVDGKVVLTIISCHSGKFLDDFTEIDAGPQGVDKFVQDFKNAGTGADAVKKNGKYKILTAAGEGQALASETTLSDGVHYWSNGMGQSYYLGEVERFADKVGTDYLGTVYYGNGDGKVSLQELYDYAKGPIYKRIVEKRKSQENDSEIPKEKYIIVSYPRVYPENDDFVIYQ